MDGKILPKKSSSDYKDRIFSNSSYEIFTQRKKLMASSDGNESKKHSIKTEPIATKISNNNQPPKKKKKSSSSKRDSIASVDAEWIHDDILA
jgi:hypothetical protein